MTRIVLCDAAEVREGEPMRVEVDGTGYALFRVDGVLHVTDDLCSHGPGNLSDGWLDGYEIECPFHQGRFDVRTGAPTAPPCFQPVRTFRPELEGGRIVIDLARPG